MSYVDCFGIKIYFEHTDSIWKKIKLSKLFRIKK